MTPRPTARCRPNTSCVGPLVLLLALCLIALGCTKQPPEYPLGFAFHERSKEAGSAKIELATWHLAIAEAASGPTSYRAVSSLERFSPLAEAGGR